VNKPPPEKKQFEFSFRLVMLCNIYAIIIVAHVVTLQKFVNLEGFWYKFASMTGGVCLLTLFSYVLIWSANTESSDAFGTQVALYCVMTAVFWATIITPWL
jgi:hypothetical protein